jgi:PAS domain S-box-containing protein
LLPQERTRKPILIGPDQTQKEFLPSRKVRKMKDQRKTKDQLIAELREMRRRVAELEKWGLMGSPIREGPTNVNSQRRCPDKSAARGLPEEAIARLRPGDHLCCIYQTEEEHRAVLTPFLRQGLERGEKVVYIADTHSTEMVTDYLRDVGVDARPYLASGQLVILSSAEVHISNGVFDPDRMIDLLRSETEQAVAEGYHALRVTGETTWVMRELPGSDRLIEYEAKLNTFFPGSKCLAICQYDRHRFDPQILLDVLSTHPTVAVGTRIYDNFYSVPPADFLGEGRSAAQLHHWLENLEERRKNEEALRQSEEKFRVLFEGAPESIAIVGLDGIVLDCNPATEKVAGIHRGEIVGKHFTKLGVLPLKDIPKYGKLLTRLLSGKDVGHVEVQLKGTEGTTRWVEAFPTLLRRDGKASAIQVIARDITERKRAENLMRAQRDLGLALSGARGLDETLRLCLETAISVSGMECGAIYLTDEATGGLYLASHQALSPEFARAVSHYDADSPNTRLVMAGHPTYASHRELGLPLSDAEVRESLRAVAVLPVHYEDRVIGCLNLASHTLDEVPEFSRTSLETIAAQIGNAIARSRVEQALSDSEALYQSLVENLPQNILRKDRQGRFTFANSNFCTSLGKPLDQVLGKTDFDFYPAPLAEKYRQDDRKVVETGETFEDVEEHQTPDGRRLYVQVIKTPVVDSEGKVIGVQGIFWDVTGRKRAEDESTTLARLATRLAGTASIESMIIGVRDETEHLFGWNSHFFAVRRPEEETFHVVSFVDTVDGKKTAFDREDWPPDRLSPPVRPVLEGRSVLINRKPGVSTPSLTPFGNEDRPSASLMYVPIRSSDRVIGIISVQSYSYGRYGQSELHTLQRIADAIAPALERAYAGEALLQSETRYRALFESAGDAIFLTKVTNHDIRIVDCNPQALAMFGCRREEMIGSTPYDFSPPAQGDGRPSEDKGDEKIRAALGGISQRFEWLHRRSDGTVFDADVTLTRVDLGNEYHVLAVVRDVTERKRAEEENQRLQEQLALAQKMEALGTLAGGIAHEFNNINAAIIGYVDLTLQTENLSDAACRNLEIVRASAARGADLTRSLLVFSRKDVGERKPVDLRDVVEGVLRVTAKEFASEGIETAVSHSANVPAVMANAPMLESVVMNLVVNARHAMLNSKVKKLTIRTGQERGKAFIRVKDTGCGIAKKDIRRIFEPFFTTKGSLAAGEVFDGKARGTGLGLSVSHSIVEAHRGQITVTSRLGKGATFTVYLPVASKRKTTRREVEASPREEAPRIMVVDDEEAITSLLVDILGHAGYEADGFTNPLEAASAFHAEPYALAFVDLQMPQMSGEDFIGLLNKLPIETRPLTVVLTGRPDVADEDYRRLHAFATLLKPFDTQEVISIVERIGARKPRPFTEENH